MHYRGKLLSLTKKVVPEVNAFCHSDVPATTISTMVDIGHALIYE